MGTAQHNWSTGDFFYQQLPQQGWQCPVCLKVYSPSTPMCFTNHNNMTTLTTTATTKKPKKKAN